MSSEYALQGLVGNVSKYITRTQAVKRLQLRLADFRCAAVSRCHLRCGACHLLLCISRLQEQCQAFPACGRAWACRRAANGA